MSLAGLLAKQMTEEDMKRSALGNQSTIIHGYTLFISVLFFWIVGCTKETKGHIPNGEQATNTGIV